VGVVVVGWGGVVLWWLVEARIDPGLSIETYYRSQEAKGIQATPKGDDFDNVHRR
jgi:hypothetical protein